VRQASAAVEAPFTIQGRGNNLCQVAEGEYVLKIGSAGLQLLHEHERGAANSTFLICFVAKAPELDFFLSLHNLNIQYLSKVLLYNDVVLVYNMYTYIVTFKSVTT
jgi:hypothetical protein